MHHHIWWWPLLLTIQSSSPGWNRNCWNLTIVHLPAFPNHNLPWLRRKELRQPWSSLRSCSSCSHRFSQTCWEHPPRSMSSAPGSGVPFWQVPRVLPTACSHQRSSCRQSWWSCRRWSLPLLKSRRPWQKRWRRWCRPPPLACRASSGPPSIETCLRRGRRASPDREQRKAYVYCSLVGQSTSPQNRRPPKEVGETAFVQQSGVATSLFRKLVTADIHTSLLRRCCTCDSCHYRTQIRSLSILVTRALSNSLSNSCCWDLNYVTLVANYWMTLSVQ